jgi:hypothetical protein
VATQLEKALATLGWSGTGFSRRLGVQACTARKWMLGRREIPAEVVEWLTLLAATVARLPALPRIGGDKAAPWRVVVGRHVLTRSPGGGRTR